MRACLLVTLLFAGALSQFEAQPKGIGHRLRRRRGRMRRRGGVDDVEATCEDIFDTGFGKFAAKELKQELGPDSDEPFTFFHPTKRAFIEWIGWWWRQQKQMPSHEYLENIMRLHFLPKTLLSKDIKEGPNICPTMMNASKYVNLNDDAQVLNIKKKTGVHPKHELKVLFGVPDWKMNIARVIKKDIKCGKGVVHIIDKVMWFPRYATDVMRDANAIAMASAVSSAGVNSLFDTTANITIFVPLNEALEAILSDKPADPAALKDILETHVHKGTVYSPDITREGSLVMWNGKKVSIELTNGDVKIGGANVLVRDILLRNGVAHLVDDVLQPTGGKITMTQEDGLEHAHK